MSTTKHEAFEVMQNLGGGFASRLADCWFHADDQNKAKIEAAFPDLINHYLDLLESTLSGAEDKS